MDQTQAGNAAALTSLIHCPDSYVEPLHMDKVFPRPQPLEVELGSGDGGFLTTWAAQHPFRDFIGIERLLGRLRKVNRKGLRAGLVNLRLIRIEAAYFMQYLLPPASTEVIHVYFPDPWPKRRHWKKRLVNAPFVDAAARALKAEGRIYLRTDNEPYHQQITSLFESDPRFSGVETPPGLAAVLTDFERDFLERGLCILRAAFQRRSAI